MDWYVGTEWHDEVRGLHKKVLKLQFVEVEKPLSTSTVIFIINKLCTNLGSRPSKYLTSSETQPHTMEMGSAVKPIDCYLELLLQQFLPGETSACSIQTKTGERLEFELKLERIVSNVQVNKLNAVDIHALALRYKKSGVDMFKSYPKFALDYFSRAAKLLITYKPFDQLNEKSNGIEGTELATLLIQIQTNMAACLLQEQRYEHVIYHTEFVETEEKPSEKSIYRRALAYFHLKEFKKAQQTIERVPGYEQKRDFCNLRDNIAAHRRNSDASYKQVMQRMFS